MVDIKLELNYYTSKIISFFYNLYGFILGFFTSNNKELENVETTTDNDKSVLNKIFKPFNKLWERFEDIYYKWCLNILKQKEVPKHIGFIMDGNRRYARMNNINPYVAHLRGFESLEKVINPYHILIWRDIFLYLSYLLMNL